MNHRAIQSVFGKWNNSYGSKRSNPYNPNGNRYRSEKVCTMCLVEKDSIEFGKLKSSKFGMSARCKACARLKHKAWRDRNPDKIAPRLLKLQNAVAEGVIKGRRRKGDIEVKFIRSYRLQIDFSREFCDGKWVGPSTIHGKVNWRKPVQLLDDTYVKARIRAVGAGIRNAEIPASLVELKRLTMLIKREAARKFTTPQT